MGMEMTDDKQQIVFVLLVHQWADKKSVLPWTGNFWNH